MVDQFWLHFNGTGGPGPYISKKNGGPFNNAILSGFSYKGRGAGCDFFG
jgi:hypothetical protein